MLKHAEALQAGRLASLNIIKACSGHVLNCHESIWLMTQEQPSRKEDEDAQFSPKDRTHLK